MDYPQQGYFVHTTISQPQLSFNRPPPNIRAAQLCWPQQPRFDIPPAHLQIGMNPFFRTYGPPGSGLNLSEAAAAAAMVARLMGHQVTTTTMMRGVGHVPHQFAAATSSNAGMVAVNQQAAIVPQQRATQKPVLKQNLTANIYKFNPTIPPPTHSMTIKYHQTVPQGYPPPYVHIQEQDPLTSSVLAAARPQEKKQILGELLFPVIEKMFPELAAKITGMLLEIDNSKLIHMLEDGEYLKEKVDEAVAVLQAHQSKTK